MASLKRPRTDYDSDDDDDDEPALGKQTLPVANLPADFDQEPMDGMQYLFLVRRDAKKLPSVTRVSNPYEKPEKPVAGPSTVAEFSHFIPSDEWREVFELRFQSFRKNLAQPTTRIGPPEPTQLLMPNKKDRDMWWAFLCGKPSSEWIPRRKSKKQKGRAQIDEFGSSMRSWEEEEPSEIVFDVAELEQQQPQNDEGEVEQALQLDPAESLPSPRHSPPRIATTEEGLVPREPTTRVLHLIDERTALHIIMYFTHWMNLYLQSSNNAASYVPTDAHARWIFGLLSRVDDFISADDTNLLRNLGRSCIQLLKDMKENPEVDNRIWKQRDLWDDAQQMLRRLPAL